MYARGNYGKWLSGMIDAEDGMEYGTAGEDGS